MLPTRLKTATVMLVVIAASAPGLCWVADPMLASTPHASPNSVESTPGSQASKVTLLRAPEKGLQPQAVMDAKGVLHLIYFLGDPKGGNIFYVRSEDAGATFSRPIQVNSQAGSAVAAGNIRGAHLAVGRNGRAHVAWMGSGKAEPKGPSDATPMLYSHLNDGGTAFEPQRNVIHAAVGLDGGGSVAADDAGNVYIAWHAPEPGAKGHQEQNRRVWVVRLTNDGKSFVDETVASEAGTGCCGCCGMRAFADRKGNVYFLYRSAKQEVNRDTYLLVSKDRGQKFQSDKVQPWNVSKCPMSSYAFAEGKDGVLAAWETDGQVSFARIDPESGKRSDPVPAPGSGKDRKHPAIAGNGRGETILVWTEGMGWNRGGTVVWQVFDKGGKPSTETGRADGVPTWSLVTVFPRPDGGFAIIY